MKVTVVVAYNTQVEMTKDFLETMWETTTNFRKIHKLDLILVNGGCPTDITHDIVTDYVRLEKNIGFAVTVNAGLRRVPQDTDYVFYVGNDSFPTTTDWLERLILLQIKTQAGIVCPANDRPGMDALAHCYKEEFIDYWTSQFFPSIAYLITKECFDAVGLWDEAFVNSGMYGDNDYCIRTCQAGFKIVVSKDILLLHLLSQEAPKLFNIDVDMSYNEQVLKKKWGLK